MSKSKAKPKTPNGKCAVCTHVERTRIELLLAEGAAQTALARKFGVGKFVIHRHWHSHVSEERRANLILGPVQRAKLAARVAEESESVLDHHKVVRAGLLHLYDAALGAGDRTGGALLAGRLTEVNNSIGRLTGELASSPLIQQNTINNFFLQPEFLTFQQDLIRVLSRFPEAREAVIAEFERLEQLSQPQRPALEHDP